jgi:cytochrome b6-f complex iron-sulfur subunit
MNEEQEELRKYPMCGVSRRRALELIAGAAAGAASAGCLFASPLLASPHVGFPQKVLVGQLKDLPPGSSLTATYMQQPVIVFNADGQLGAFSAICTHEGCLVAWSRDRRLLLCPCHGGVFDTSGQVVEGPPPAALLGFNVVVEDGSIYLNGVRGEK